MNKEYDVGDIIVVKHDKDYIIGIISRIEYNLNDKSTKQKKKYLVYFTESRHFILFNKRQIKCKIDSIEIQNMSPIIENFKFINNRIEKGGGRFGI